MMNHENIVESVMLVLEATVKLHPLGKRSKKKIADKEALVHMGGRGVKKKPFF